MNFSDIEKRIDKIIRTKYMSPNSGEFKLIKGFITVRSQKIWPPRLTSEREDLPIVAITDSNEEIHFFLLDDLLTHKD